ncbi:putative mediator of RNA polymerase II transcription subunit 26 isoform X7 [Calliphora vicina]|uniref:putative mediator of RNA polymerase II transcription subunit 26 isoform X7 n=1 Tax=Calliphora vicina TaxID=7373 RepID=UPI00325B8ED0
MEMSMERDSSALGSLFQQIINDMKNTSPLWEDFVAKASKLHACLRAAIQAIAAYLDAFQKIADAATNSRGASKEIGTALTRVCLRHKAVETRLKTFTAAIMDCLVQPLQDKLEDWKRSVATIDKEHAKEYKRCRTELKKRSTDTLRLQKKARKGQSDTLQSLMDSHMQDVTLRRAELEEVEKKSLRSAMIEERMRYCSFVHMLQPVVKEECEVMSELGHLQEAMQSIALVTKEPQVLPAASEELIHDAKASITLYPESPSASAGGGGSLSQGGCSNSLGSRKSSVCSISSMNSSGSSNSPGHPHYPRSLSQLISPSIRLKPGESSDSGFCSSPALTTQASSINNPSHAVTTWPTHSQDTVDLPSNASERPHTISSAYEKGHQRPPLTVYTFQNPETIHEAGGGVNAAAINNGSGGGGSSSGQNTPSTQKSPAGALTRPPLPVRCSSLERPLSANNSRGNGTNLMQRQCPSPIPAHVTKELSAHLAQQQHQQQLLLQQQQQPNHQQTSPPTYVNMSELANMAAMKITNQQQQQLQQQQQQSPTIHQQQQMLQQQHSIDSISSIHSNDSSASMHLNQSQQLQHVQTTPPSHHQQQSTRSHSSNSNTPSLHSHPSIESTVATPPIGQTPSASSGSSTPQNHYSPLLTNSPSSTAAGTPSGASITSSGLTTSGAAGGTNSGNNFMYNVCSPTPPQSANSSQASDILKITESDGNNGIVVAPSPLTSQTNDSNAYSSNSANNQEISNSNTDADSSGNVVENDERSRASVLQKASMFEKQAAAVKSTPTPPAIASCSMSRNSVAVAANIDNSTNAGIYGTRTSNQSQHQQQQSQSIDPQEVDKCFEDSLQELNNLIGELDSFQREIDASKQDKEHHKNVKNLYDGIDSYISNETMTIITDDTSTTIICETTQQQHLQQSQQEKDFCTASNQTNSSGCGTDISDTTSEDCNADTRSLTSQTGVGGCGGGNELIGGLLKTNLKALSGGAFNSDSELSRCYISETSSIMGGCAGDGYENPTFAHFAASSSASQCYDDNRSDSLSLQRQAMYGDNMSDNGSNVVVIYDHQPPITPDIDYCKQNSEIVMLRTKPAQHSQYSQEMRELQQLPDNLTETSSPTSPNGTTDHSMHQHTATVAPAKQRLSSFRASSEQLQLLNSSPTAAATTKGSTRIARRSSVNTAKPPPPVRRSSSVTPSPNTPTTPTNSNAINMLHQQQAHSLNTSTENLPPPPAYLLDARQTTPTSPPSVMPNSSQKVSETVKALSGLRHQPASPHTLRRLQQQQQQQQQQHQPQSMLQPPKQYQHQYTKSSPVLLSPPTTKRTMPTPLSPQSPLQTDLDEIPPPLPPPNPNQTPHHHHQHQLSLPLRYQQQLPTPTMTAHSNNNHMPPQQQLQHHQQQQLQHQYQDHQQLDYNNGEAIYGTNSPTSFRTSSPGGGIYAQPKILNNMSSFRTNSPGPNGHQTPTQSHVPAQPKTNPNLIAQLNARLNSKQPSSNEAIYGVSSINHQQQREEIYMRNYQQLTPHASQPPPPQQQQQQQQTYDAAETNANATFNTNQNQYSSSQYYAPKHLTAAHQQQPTQQHVQKVANATNNQPSRQLHQSMPMSQSPLPPPELAAQQSHYQTGHQHQPQQQREPIHHTAQHYTCPPPLEDPPPPPIYINNNSATMPKRGASSHHNHHHQQPANLATYAAASSVSTLPKNMIQQQRLQQQQQQQLQLQQQQQAIYGTHQAQQQQYHAPGAITSAHQQAQQYQNPQHISQRPPMPLPHHQQQQQQQQQQSSSTGNRHKAATVNIKQPPVPSRHSSVQQKIFVATNPFIQTTTIHCHSPTASSVHSQPASPICSSPTPSSVASIYGTSSRRSSGSGGGNSGGVGMAQYDVGGGGNAGQVYYNHQLNTATNTNYTSTNVDKNASIRTKTKAEFLENLNAKLAKQSLSGRAFAVRNLINSKALPDPRICHESLMDQIKRGAPLKRNQKINDRSAPKIY